ncbi:MAG: DUF4340 domain-containing protein [Planctomycetes bacterium]|nr:DUF4340 domain-containing protein [Planctomycetota bacterium]MCW8134658.1 DUF4340 domain-containing protein [Planctomycetota bacterium]
MTEPAKTEASRLTPDEVIAAQRNKQLIIVTAVIAVLAGLVAITRLTGKVEAPVREVPLTGGTLEKPGLEKSEVARIEIFSGQGKLELTNQGGWRIPTRFNAPVDEREVDSLLTKLRDSRRLSRPASTRPETFVLYRLDDESAAHLRLSDKSGKELLHLLIGRAESGNRAFVRLTGQGAPEGVYEVTDMTGDFDSLYSRLNLNGEGEPDARRWLDLSGFRPLPYSAVARSIAVRDGAHEMRFSRTPGSDDAADLWEMTSPRKAKANGANVRGIVDALMNLNASDIAGRLHPDGPALGVAQPEREITLEYTDESRQVTVRLYFGVKKDNSVAVLLKSADQGELVYWCSDWALTRMFRPMGEYLERQRHTLVPDGVQPAQLTIFKEGAVVRLERDEAERWKLTEPFTGKASAIEVSNLLTTLMALQGYRETMDDTRRSQLKLGPGLSTHWIEAQFKPRKEGDGDEEPDTPEAPVPTLPALKRATLYFGEVQDGEVPVLRKEDGVDDQVFWLDSARIKDLFVPARELQESENTGGLKFNDQPAVITLRNGEAAIKLEKSDGWKIAGEAPVAADSTVIDQVLRALRSLAGVRHEGVINHAALGVSEDAASAITLALGKEEGAETIELRLGKPDGGYVPVLTLRGSAEPRLHWVREQDTAALLPDFADFAVPAPFKARVRQVLVAYTDNPGGVAPRSARTRAEAQELANRVLEQARTGKVFTALQTEFNDDAAAPEGEYEVDEKAGRFPKPFVRAAAGLAVGEVGVIESRLGFHVVKRVE